MQVLGRIPIRLQLAPDSSHRSMVRFFITPTPTRQVPVDEWFDVDTQCVKCMYQRPQIRSARSAARPLALIHGTSNLAQVPTDGTYLGDDTERQPTSKDLPAHYSNV
jgi:hypothetical protein